MLQKATIRSDKREIEMFWMFWSVHYHSGILIDEWKSSWRLWWILGEFFLWSPIIKKQTLSFLWARKWKLLAWHLNKILNTLSRIDKLGAHSGLFTVMVWITSAFDLVDKFLHFCMTKSLDHTYFFLLDKL